MPVCVKNILLGHVCFICCFFLHLGHLKHAIKHSLPDKSGQVVCQKYDGMAVSSSYHTNFFTQSQQVNHQLIILFDFTFLFGGNHFCSYFGRLLYRFHHQRTCAAL